MKKRTIRLYAHLLAPITSEGVGSKHWRAIWIIQQVSESLARMFGGKADCSSCDIVQYDDTIVFDNISDVQMQFILDSHSFVKEIKYSYK